MHVTEAEALGIGGRVKENYDGRENLPNPTPSSIEFLRSAPQYSYYNSSSTPANKFYEENYKGKFLWYSMVPRQGATKYQAYMARMRENLQTSNGTRQFEIPSYATHSSSVPYRYNLKTGSDSPWDNDGFSDGYNSGTQVVTDGSFEGKYFEWRYLGYSADGHPISNPYFPDDYASNNRDSYWRGKNFIKESWYDGYANFEPTIWDDPGYRNQKIAWINKYFKPKHPGLFSGSKDAGYWADHLSLRNNPDLSTGILEGWHLSGGRYFYKTFTMTSPKRPNLRLTNFKIVDPETNKLVGLVTRNTTDPYKFNSTTSNQTQQYVSKGKTYTITGTIKNMKEPGLSAHNTTYRPVHVELIVGYDKTAREYNAIDEVYACNPVTPTNTIRYDNATNFACTFTIPTDKFEDEIELGFRIPNGFFLAGDNANNEDDISQIIFKPSPNDMAVKDQIDFLDQNGNVVETVTPLETYSVRFRITRPHGDVPVGEIGDPNNPFTMINVTSTDKGTVSTNKRVVAQEVLRKGNTIELIAVNAIQPRTNLIESCVEINYLHVTKGQNILNGNDKKCATLQSDINISVKDFVIKPQSVYLPSNMNTSYETVRFDFNITNYNEEKRSKNIPYVIKKGNTVIYQGMKYNVPPNVAIQESVTIGNIPLSQGNHGFTVEVNPPPRLWFESVKDVANPYLDNVATNSMLVIKAPTVVKCDVENTRNTWTTTYSIYEWWGYEDRSWIRGYWNYDNRGRRTTYTSGYWNYYCVTTRTKSSTQTINHYEDYSIKQVLFRSKLTDDNNGGWINIKGGGVGKVKAGYGFEIKVIANYNTNIDSTPKSWSSGCSGKSVSPTTGTVKAKERITLTMPFKDKAGKDVKYTLNANVSGSWSNETQTYEMPMRNAFNLKNTREIFVNEGAKDGEYSIKIETDGTFQGSSDKPYNRNLCDVENVTIKILGSNSDDLKTHITQ